MVWVLLALGITWVYWFPVRRRFQTWGSSTKDRGRPMLGDAAVSIPTYVATLAITIDAPPSLVWPWLAQMGYKRGGLYSYDWLDRLFGYLDRPSAISILPEFQHLTVGDEIPMGRGAGFPVTAVEPGRALVLSGRGDEFEWAWQFALIPVTERQTRLVSRNQVRVPPGLGSWLFMRVIEPAAFLMTRRMLIGIRQRAERLAAVSGPAPQRAA